MNCLEKIKSQILDHRNRGGRQDIPVNFRALLELVEMFESIDAEERFRHDKGRLCMERDLHLALTAVYHKNHKNTEETMLTIMETLTPLMEENLKLKQIKAIHKDYMHE